MYAKEYTVEELKQIGVYRIITPGGGVYIGMTTVGFAKRWTQHKLTLNNGRHKCIALKNSFNKNNNDWDLFKLEILKKWDLKYFRQNSEIIEKEILHEEKIAWIKHKNSGYNMIHGCPSGIGSVVHTEETRKRIGSSRRKNIQLQIDNGGVIPKTIILDSELVLIKIDYENGLDIATIAKKYNKTNKAINLKAKENNFIRPKKRFSSYDETLSRIPIKQWYFEEGKNIIEIAELTGYSSVHIWRLLEYIKTKGGVLDNATIREKSRKKAAETVKNKPKVQCKYCSKLIGSTVIQLHVRACPKNPDVIKRLGEEIEICV